MNIQKRFALYAPDWELSFNVRIATQTILSKVVKIVQVNNTTDVRIARTVLLPSTTYKALYVRPYLLPPIYQHLSCYCVAW